MGSDSCASDPVEGLDSGAKELATAGSREVGVYTDSTPSAGNPGQFTKGSKPRLSVLAVPVGFDIFNAFYGFILSDFVGFSLYRSDLVVVPVAVWLCFVE